MSGEYFGTALWSAGELCAAFDALLSAAGLPKRETESAGEYAIESREHAFELITWLAKCANCEAEPFRVEADDITQRLQGKCPALLVTSSNQYLAVLRADRKVAVVVGPNGKLHQIPLSTVSKLTRSHEETERRISFSRLLSAIRPRDSRFEAQLDGLVSHNSGLQPVQVGCSIRELPSGGLIRFLTQSAAWRNASVLLGAHTFEYVLWLVSWSILGRMSFAGQMDRGLLIAWSLLLLTIVPLRVLSTYAQGVLAVSIGAALKRRLLRGTLRLPADEVRQLGTGSVLGQVFESQNVESLALSGGVAGCLAVIELVVSGLILGLLSLLLFLVCVLLAWAGYRFWRQYREWTGARMQMTFDLIENMVGHRTRIAQQQSADWHTEEDRRLEEYAEHSYSVDRQGSWLVAALPRLWLIAALICLAPQAISSMQSTSTLAIRLGGVLLAFTSLKKLTGAAVEIGGTIIAASRIARLFAAGSNGEVVGTMPPAPSRSEIAEDAHSKVVELEKVRFRYAPGAKLTLDNANLTIRSGERVLIEGPSGGGKSTLAALLSGLREPESGVLLGGGLDRMTLGESAWRKLVTNAPQFHDNHVLTETLAFNLLMGRSWPPRARDLAEAEAICRELGLGDLLDRMPSGLSQMVGEGGWQLSQGERSRVFLARALLQGARLTILDESFGALDPENLQSAMECTLARTDALMVIAHP